MKKILSMLVISLLVLSMILVAPRTYATEAKIWTDKEDYAPTEAVTMFGWGFEPLAVVTVAIEMPNGTSDTVYPYPVTDDVGGFVCTYQLDGMLGIYTVTATDGTNTATTTFTEGAITPELWGYTLEPSPGWTHGDVKGYYECQWVPYKIEVENTKKDWSGQLTVVVHHDYFDGTYYGLDQVRNFAGPGSISGPTVDGWESGIQQLQWSWTFTINKDETCTLTFEVHVAIGAHNYQGSKVHTHIHDIIPVPDTSISGGHRDVPIVVKGPPPGADVAIQKTGVNYAHEGETISYQFTVTNYGPSTALNVQVIDNILGDLTGRLPDTTLDVMEVNTFSVNYVVPSPSGDITNTVTVTSTTSDPNPANNQASWTVDVLHPAIDVAKSGPLYAHEGDTITYTIIVSNPSTDTTMFKVSVIDSLLGDISASFSASLAPLASESKTFTYTVPSPSGDITNTVTATYKNGLNQPKTDSDSWTVDVLHPGIDVTKTGPLYAHEGDTITYTITVSNTGDCPLYSVFVTDTLLGPIYSNGLAFGETKIFTVSYNIPIPSGDISNTVTASGSDFLGLSVSDSANWTVDILHPGIYVTKIANATQIHYCDWVEYTITVVNTGDCPLYVVKDDPILGLHWEGWLAPGEVHVEVVDYHPEEDPTINIVSVTGEDELGRVVEDKASWTVDILHPGIEVTKIANATQIHYCDWVEYTITVVNTGDCPLYVVKDDPILGLHWEGWLAPGEVHVEVVDYHPEEDPTINIVSVTGEDELGMTFSDSASWTVDILHPGISVCKSGPLYAHEGDTITYTITVSNTGDCPLHSVSVTDTLLGPIYSNGLAFGETKTFTLTYNVPSPSTVISNSVTAVGYDILGLQVSDSDNWTVTVLHPDIHVTKSGPNYAHEGDTITYTITVSNTGDCPLYSVFVTDTLLGPIYSNGLAFGETKIFTVSYNIPIPSGDISNTVTALGYDILGLQVSDSASWFVKIQYRITVTASPAGAIGGTFKVTYTKSGTTYTNVLQTTTWTEWVDSGTPVTVSDPQDPIDNGPGTRYKFDHYDPSASVLMTGHKTITLVYRTQYYLTVKTDPEGLNPAPLGEGWYDECTTVNIMAPPVSYLDHNEYVFVYWDIDTSILTSEDLIHIHMDMPHTATAHYWLPSPRHLDAEPPSLIDLTKPECTQWHELYPEYCRNYHLQSWHDMNQDGKLSPSDYIDLWDEDHQWKVRPYFWHIDDITVTLKVYNINTKETMYIEFEGGWAGYERLIKTPGNPKGTWWHEVYPQYSSRYYLEKWYDNCNAKLSYCDRIILRDNATGELAEYHVEEVKTDLIISPQATHVVLCEMKDNVGKGYSQIICETIHNYYGGTTAFTVSAYYNGLQPIGNQTIILNPLESGDAVILWNETATWPMGTYDYTITINTYVNDTLLYSTSFAIEFKITIVGDVNGDGIVDIADIYAVALAFGAALCEPRWDPNYDVNNDLIIDISDIYMIAINFGNTDP